MSFGVGLGFFVCLGFHLGWWLFFGGRGRGCFVLFFQNAQDLTPVVFMEAFTVFVAV